MLVLTRKLGEGITIGDGIRITILGVRSGHVRLGIDAPPNTGIYRDEIYARIMDENRRAAEGMHDEASLDACLTRGAWPNRRGGA